MPSPGIQREMIAIPDMTDMAAVYAAARQVQAQALALEVEQRRLAVRYAWLLCGCSPYYDRDNPGKPAQAGCLVHSGIIVTLTGEII